MAGRLAVWAVAGVALAAAGCARGNAAPAVAPVPTSGAATTAGPLDYMLNGLNSALGKLNGNDTAGAATELSELWTSQNNWNSGKTGWVLVAGQALAMTIQSARVALQQTTPDVAAATTWTNVSVMAASGPPPGHTVPQKLSAACKKDPKFCLKLLEDVLAHHGH